MIATDPFRARTAIVGVADAVDPSGELDGTVRSLEVRMIREALTDAGLTIADVDGVASCISPGWAPSLELAEYLGIAPRWTDSTQTGGSSFEVQVQHAAAAIAAGMAEVVVVVYAAT
ncbi:MAG: thiolase, partial [Planctomycetes bacterium]|nr:thiolase [Planctomycetota bacterium]